MVTVMISSTDFFVSTILREPNLLNRSSHVIAVELTGLCADNILYSA